MLGESFVYYNNPVQPGVQIVWVCNSRKIFHNVIAEGKKSHRGTYIIFYSNVPISKACRSVNGFSISFFYPTIGT